MSSPTPIPPTPPGWHRDPSGRYSLRWADGRSWTDHVVDAAQRQGTDPGAPAPRPSGRGDGHSCRCAGRHHGARRRHRHVHEARRRKQATPFPERCPPDRSRWAPRSLSADDTIGPDGGTIVLDEAASDGFELEVPAGALATDTTIEVTAAPIEAIDDGPLVTPLSPLYTVHAGDTCTLQISSRSPCRWRSRPAGWRWGSSWMPTPVGSRACPCCVPTSTRSRWPRATSRRSSSAASSKNVRAHLGQHRFRPHGRHLAVPEPGHRVRPRSVTAPGCPSPSCGSSSSSAPCATATSVAGMTTLLAFSVGPATPNPLGGRRPRAALGHVDAERRAVDDVRRLDRRLEGDVPTRSRHPARRIPLLDGPDRRAAVRRPQHRDRSAVTRHRRLRGRGRHDPRRRPQLAEPGPTRASSTSPRTERSGPSSRPCRPTRRASPSRRSATPPSRRCSTGTPSVAVSPRRKPARSAWIASSRPTWWPSSSTVDGIEDHRLLVDGYVPTRNPLPVYVAVTGVDGRFRTSVFLGTSDTPVATADVTMTAGLPVPTTGF